MGLEAPHQTRDLGGERTSVGMDLVEDEVPQGRREESSVFLADEQEFELLVVREQDVRRIASNRMPGTSLGLRRLLAESLARGVAIARIEPEGEIETASPDQASQTLELVVRKRVHR